MTEAAQTEENREDHPNPNFRGGEEGGGKDVSLS